MDPMCTLKKREGNSELFLKSQGIPLEGNDAIEKKSSNWVSLVEEDTYEEKEAIVFGD